MKYLSGYAGVLLAMGLALGAAYYFWGDAFAALMKPVSSSAGQQELDVKAMASGWPRLALLFLSTCAVAPLAEELFFRRIIYAGLRSRQGFWPAAFWSGLLFALFHGGAAPVTLPVGIYFCWVYERERRLPVVIFLHCLVNVLAVSYRALG